MEAAVCVQSQPTGPTYIRRQPEKTALYQVLQQHLLTFEQQWTDEANGRTLPKFVLDELHGFMACGILAKGFAHLYCESCGQHHVVAFSCKARAVPELSRQTGNGGHSQEAPAHHRAGPRPDRPRRYEELAGIRKYRGDIVKPMWEKLRRLPSCSLSRGRCEMKRISFVVGTLVLLGGCGSSTDSSKDATGPLGGNDGAVPVAKLDATLFPDSGLGPKLDSATADVSSLGGSDSLGMDISPSVDAPQGSSLDGDVPDARGADLAKLDGKLDAQADLRDSTTEAGDANVGVIDGGGAHELIQQLAAGDSFTCALTARGAVKCWGTGAGLGAGRAIGAAAQGTAVEAVGLSSGVKRIAASGGVACAIKQDDQVVCWGVNYFGELDTDAGISPGSYVPVALREFVGAAVDVSVTQNLSSKMDHGCIVDSSFNISCWGANNNYQLGVEGIASSGTVVTSPTLAGFKAVAAGGGSGSSPGFTCGLTLGGGVKCWGSNSAGRLGIGEIDGGLRVTSSVPMQTFGLESGVVQIVASGRGTACALTAEGVAKCWGEGSYGALPPDPDRGAGFSSTPLTIGGLGTVKQLAAGLMHLCALRTDGTMKCWGYDLNGQLGDQPANITVNLSRSTPVDVIGVTDIVTIAAGNEHTCAAPSTGGVLCWGGSSGTGRTLAGNQLQPTFVGGL